MAASPILLQSKIKWNPISQAFPLRTSRTNSKFITRNPKFIGILCSCNRIRIISGVEASANNLERVMKNLNKSVSESFVSTSSIMDEALMALRKHVVAGVLVGCFLLLRLCGCNCKPALAASGGRMGGRCFSSRSSSSSSSFGFSSGSSSSSSSSSRGDYWSSFGFSSDSGSSSSSSRRGYSRSFGFSSGSGSGSSSSSSRDWSSFNFSSDSDSGSSSSSSSPSSRGDYSSSYRFSSASPSYHYSNPSTSYMSVPYSSSFSIFAIIGGLFAFMVVSDLLKSDGGVFSATGKTSVVKLQVGLLGMARSLQSDLNRIANTADTSSQTGLSYILTETVLALLRHPDYCISGYSSVDLKRSIEDGEKRFNQLSIEERGKFDVETLVNVNSIRKQYSTSQTASGFRNEYIVITILVAAEGEHKLPAIKSSGDLKTALEKLGSIPSSKIMAVEVLWTPQNENDTLTERELLEDYSLLRPL